MEEVPDAEVVAEGDPIGPPGQLNESWRPVARGLQRVQQGLAILFAGWGLLLLAAFADLVFRLVDKERADRLFVFVLLGANLLFAVVSAMLAAGRRLSCAATKEGLDRRLGQRSAATGALEALLWVVLLVWAALSLGALPLPWLLGGWLLALAVGGTADVMFMLYLRALGRSLSDREILEEAGWFFRGRGRYLSLGLGALIAAAFVSGFLVGTAEEGSSFPVDLALLALVILLGVASTAVVARYLRVAAAAQESVEDRLPEKPSEDAVA
jgi:hypothetical protein